MKEVTSWKVFKTIDAGGEPRTVLVGYNPELKAGIIEVVTSGSIGEVNGYKLVGSNNSYFLEFNELWHKWTSENLINNITDISDHYE